MKQKRKRQRQKRRRHGIRKLARKRFAKIKRKKIICAMLLKTKRILAMNIVAEICRAFLASPSCSLKDQDRCLLPKFALVIACWWRMPGD
jgi:hypothetical protein